MDPTISPEVKPELCSRHGVSQLQARAGCQKTKSSLRIERSIFFLTSPFIEPSHTLWKSLQDFHIPTASTTGYMSSRAPQLESSHRKGVVTNVLGPQCNSCPGTLRIVRV